MHLQQLPNGRWRAQVKHAGERRWTAQAKTKREARTLAADLVRELEAEAKPGRTRRAGIPTLGDLCDDHISMTPYGVTTIDEITRARSRIPDEYATMSCAAVGPADLDKMYRTLNATVSVSGVRRVHELVSAAYGRALRYGWVRANPCASARPPARAERRMEVPSPDALRRLADAIEADPRFAAFVRLAITSGARRGELCGLRWSDIDGDSVYIGRSVAWTKTAGLVVKDTKTGASGRRTVSLDPVTIAALERWQTAKLLRHPLAAAGAAYVFGELDRPPRPDWATQRWVRLCKAEGVTGARLHDLRHFSASRLLGAGVDVVTVAGRLGHASSRTTLAIYAHALPERDREAAAIIAREIG